MLATLLLSLRFLYYAVMLLVLGSVILTWAPNLRWKPIGRLIYNLTEPIYQPLRRLFPPIRLKQGVAVDLTSFILIIAIEVVYIGLLKLLPRIIH